MSVSVGVTVVHKAAVARMRAEHSARVLYRAPVLLSAGPHLSNVSEHPVCVRAVRAVELLDEVEIGKMFAIKG